MVSQTSITQKLSDSQYSDLAAADALNFALKSVKSHVAPLVRPNPVKLQVEIQGGLFKVATLYDSAKNHQTQSNRGIIQSYSAKSRIRNLQFAARLDWAHHKSIFITLTYAESYPSPRGAKAQLRAFLKRVWRRFDKPFAVWWRLEYQKRGAPHFHLVVFDLPYYTIDDLRSDWHAVTHDKSIENFKINLLDSSTKARRYMSKYSAKVEQNQYIPCKQPIQQHEDSYFTTAPYLSAGRFWGVENRNNVPYCEQNLIIISPDHFHDFEVLESLKDMAMATYPKLRRWRGKGFFLFIEPGKAWFDLVWLAAIDSLG